MSEKPESRPNSARLEELTREWFLESVRVKYSYRFSWMGRPIIQYPQDIVAMQELIWRVKPDCILECGIAHGGSLILYASLLQLLGENGKVVGVDVDIRRHNREAIETHPMASRIEMIEGSSIDAGTVARVKEAVKGRSRILLVLDSNHTHEHVLGELRAYSPLVKKGSYVVVFDTVVEQMPDELFGDRPWRKGNSPMTAVDQFLAEQARFEIDRDFDDRYLISVAPRGFLRCVA
ncbi:MAG TPA: cephalosporin hydroxylase family protein [Polyangia bacterium]|nr:cephalosporin hydroxylase family protein [Polyangia bacterium]